MSGKTKRQHYVPQLYLRGFANPSKKKHLLFVYNKENKKTFLANIRDVAHENYFYDVDESRIVERLFSQFEAQFNIALQRLIEAEDLDKLEVVDKRVLSYFIAIQSLRTKEYRLVDKQMIDNLINILGKHNIPNFKEGSVGLTEDSLKRSHIGAMLKGFTKISRIMLNEMSWKLCINNTNTPFWTSDNPCARYNELEPDPFRGNLGLRCKGFQLHFPLSCRLLLTLMNPDVKLSDLSRMKTIKDRNLKDFKERVSKISKKLDFNIVDLIPKKEFVNEERVTFENNLQITSSTQFIFSKNNDFQLADKYLEEYPHYRDKNRKRITIT